MHGATKFAGSVPDADDLAQVSVATTVPVSGICKGLGKVPGNGANRDYSSHLRHLQKAWLTGLAKVPIATTIPALACNDAALA